MSEEKLFNYLVLGGEHDRKVVTTTRRSVLGVPADESKKLAKFSDPNVAGEVNVPQVIQYKVIEHICEDGRHFFIASNDDLTNVDVYHAIVESGIAPIN